MMNNTTRKIVRTAMKHHDAWIKRWDSETSFEYTDDEIHHVDVIDVRGHCNAKQMIICHVVCDIGFNPLITIYTKSDDSIFLITSLVDDSMMTVFNDARPDNVFNPNK